MLSYALFLKTELLVSMSKLSITPRHILFDLDGTLWDFRTNAIASLKELFENHNLKRFYNEFIDFHRLYAPCNHALWDAYAKGEVTKDFLIVERFAKPLRAVGVEDRSIAEALSRDFFVCLSKKNQLMPDALEVVQQLSQHYPMSIVSNGFPEIQFQKIGNSGLEPYFQHVILSEEVGVPKPQKGYFDAALKICGCKSSEVLLIGDEYATDIVGAHNAGIASVWYNPQKTEAPDNLHSVEINALAQLLPMLLGRK